MLILDRARTVSCRLFVFSRRTLHYPVLAAAHFPYMEFGNRSKMMPGPALGRRGFTHVSFPSWSATTSSHSHRMAKHSSWATLRFRGGHMAACNALMENEHPTTTVAGRKPMPNQVDNKHCYGLRGAAQLSLTVATPNGNTRQYASQDGQEPHVAATYRGVHPRSRRRRSLAKILTAGRAGSSRRHSGLPPARTYVRRTLQLPVRLRRE